MFVGDAAAKGQEALRGGGELAEKQLKEQEAQKAQYQKAEKSKDRKPTKSIDEVRLENDLAAKQSLDKPPVIGKKPKEAVVEPKAPVKEKGKEKGMLQKLKDKVVGPFTEKVVKDKNKGPSKDNGLAKQ